MRLTGRSLLQCTNVGTEASSGVLSLIRILPFAVRPTAEPLNLSVTWPLPRWIESVPSAPLPAGAAAGSASAAPITTASSRHPMDCSIGRVGECAMSDLLGKRKARNNAGMRVALAGLPLLVAVVVATGSAPAAVGPPRLLGLSISNGGHPFLGDTRQLASVSPNGDGYRDRAIVRFRLDRAARVLVQAVATDEVRRPVKVIWQTRRKLAAGPHTRSRGNPGRGSRAARTCCGSPSRASTAGGASTASSAHARHGRPAASSSASSASRLRS